MSYNSSVFSTNIQRLQSPVLNNTIGTSRISVGDRKQSSDATTVTQNFTTIVHKGSTLALNFIRINT